MKKLGQIVAIEYGSFQQSWNFIDVSRLNVRYYGPAKSSKWMVDVAIGRFNFEEKKAWVPFFSFFKIIFSFFKRNEKNEKKLQFFPVY